MRKIFVLVTVILSAGLLYSCEDLLLSNDGQSSPKVVQTDFEIGQPFELSFGETAINVDESIFIEFSEVNDSRCPTDVVCIWEGNGMVKLLISIKDKEAETLLNTHPNLKNSETLNGITISLSKLSPYPETAEKAIPKKEYKAILIVEAE